MSPFTSESPATGMWGTGSATGAVVNYPLRKLLPELVKAASISGIESVRLLVSEERYWNAHDKVFFVLATHDIDRDECIVRLMMQIDGVDYDLVPLASAGMIPSAAAAIC